MNRQNRAFKLFDRGLSPAEVAVSLPTAPSQACEYYAAWLQTQHCELRDVPREHDAKENYWNTEGEIGQALDALTQPDQVYTWEDLPRNEKAIILKQ